MTWNWGSGRSCACSEPEGIRHVRAVGNLILSFRFQLLNCFRSHISNCRFQPVIVKYEAHLGISNLIWCWTSSLYAMDPTKAVLQLGWYQLFVSRSCFGCALCLFGVHDSLILRLSFLYLQCRSSTLNGDSNVVIWHVWGSYTSCQKKVSVKETNLWQSGFWRLIHLCPRDRWASELLFYRGSSKLHLYSPTTPDWSDRSEPSMSLFILRRPKIPSDHVTLLRLEHQLEVRTGSNTSQGAFQGSLRDARSNFGILLLLDLTSQRYSMEHIHPCMTSTNTEQYSTPSCLHSLFRKSNSSMGSLRKTSHPRRCLKSPRCNLHWDQRHQRLSKIHLSTQQCH